MRSKECACKGSVFVWECDEHVVAPGPDVQVVGGDRKAVGSGIGFDVELAPEGVDVFLLVVQTGEFH